MPAAWLDGSHRGRPPPSLWGLPPAAQALGPWIQPIGTTTAAGDHGRGPAQAFALASCLHRVTTSRPRATDTERQELRLQITGRSFTTQGNSTETPLMAAHAAAPAKSHQSCPTLCSPIDGSPPDSPVPGILQARTLEWVSISFSNA